MFRRFRLRPRESMQHGCDMAMMDFALDARAITGQIELSLAARRQYSAQRRDTREVWAMRDICNGVQQPQDRVVGQFENSR